MGPAPPGPAAGASFSFTALTPEVRGPGVAPPRPASDPGRPADAHPRPRWGGGTRPPIQLVAMADELEALGGGDASAGRLVSCCRVAPRTHRPAPGLPIVTAGRDGTVAVRDPRAPADAPAERVVRRYRASSALGPEAGVEEVRGPPTALTGSRPPRPP